MRMIIPACTRYLPSRRTWRRAATDTKNVLIGTLWGWIAPALLSSYFGAVGVNEIAEWARWPIDPPFRDNWSHGIGGTGSLMLFGLVVFLTQLDRASARNALADLAAIRSTADEGLVPHITYGQMAWRLPGGYGSPPALPPEIIAREEAIENRWRHENPVTAQSDYVASRIGNRALDIHVSVAGEPIAELEGGACLAIFHGATVFTGELTITNRSRTHDVSIEPSLLLHADPPLIGPADPLVIPAWRDEPDLRCLMGNAPRIPYLGRRFTVPHEKSISGFLLFVVQDVYWAGNLQDKARLKETKMFLELKDILSGRCALMPMGSGYEAHVAARD